MRKSTKIYLLVCTSLYCTQLPAIGPLNPVLWEHLKSRQTKPAGSTIPVVSRAKLTTPTTTIMPVSLTSQTVSTRDYEELLFLLSGPFQ